MGFLITSSYDLLSFISIQMRNKGSVGTTGSEE